MSTQPIIFFLVLVFSTQAIAQTRGDNIIIAKNVSFKTACEVLMNEGFVIDKKDNDLLTVKTEPKMTKGVWLTTIIVYVRIVDSSARINTTFTLENTILKDEPLGYPATKKGRFQSSTATGQAWTVVHGLASKMSSDLIYERSN